MSTNDSIRPQCPLCCSLIPSEICWCFVFFLRFGFIFVANCIVAFYNRLSGFDSHMPAREIVSQAENCNHVWVKGPFDLIEITCN